MGRLASAVWITRDIERFDAVFMNRDLVPEGKVSFLEPWLGRRNPRLIFDFDDAIHLGGRERKLRRILPCFAHVTAGNEYLAEFARRLNERVSVWPTVVDTEYYRPVRFRAPGPVRIGWSGSGSTVQHYLPLLRDPICELAKRRRFEFVVIADVDPGIRWAGVDTRYIRWTPETELEGVRQIEIGLMPLHDGAFEKGKCGLKAILYGSIGVPSVVSPVGVNREIVIHGESGFQSRSCDEWVESLQMLLDDEALRHRMGSAAHQHIVDRYSVRSLLPRMIGLFQTVARNDWA